MTIRRPTDISAFGAGSEIRILPAAAVAGNDQGVPQSLSELMDTLNYHLDVQAGLCAALEKVADSLPHAVKPNDCLALARGIPAIIRRAHHFEEDVLFPFMRIHCDDLAVLNKTLDRLHGEHWEDESYAGELHLALTDFVEGDQPNADKLAYMLRGFFEGLRRHVAFEREHLLPVLARVAAP
ncbi:MAG: hemerythrin domain-containing protein [Pseudomonadota bacterium]